MSTREELEAALMARPDDATLVVYADLLQAQGDPRGELIALDLQPPDLSTSGLEKRRGQLLHAWLGDDFDVHWDPQAQLWHAGELSSTYATFDCGFIDMSVNAADYTADLVVPKLLDAAAGQYVRRVSLAGPTAMLEPLLEQLVAKRRPWLNHIAITRPPHETPRLVSATLGAQLARATPNLEVLDLIGRNLFASYFTHPNLRELGVNGSEAIDLADGPPLPALSTIDYTFDADRPTPRGLMSPERLPALRRLNFSREEPGTAVFEALGTIAVAPQLTQLVLPSLRTNRNVALVQAAIDRMPRLREVIFARTYACYGRIGDELEHAYARIAMPDAWPWPPRDRLVDMLVIDGYATDLADLVESLEEQYDDLPEDIRAIWYRFWNTLDTITVEAGLPGLLRSEQAFNAADLERAIAALVVTPHILSLRDHLRARLAQRPGGFFVAMHRA